MPPPSDDIQATFERFHAANPQVYRMLVHFARQAKAAGRERYGIGSLFERLRWHYDIETRDEMGFKLNNNLRSRYSRLIEQQEPDLRGFFEQRRLAGERDAPAVVGPPEQASFFE